MQGDERGAQARRWCGAATSVVELLRPLREQLDRSGVLEVCVNRPGEMHVETAQGWDRVACPALTLSHCLSLATAVATYCDQRVDPQHPLLSATLPSGERIQFVIPPAVTRDTVSITVRKPSRIVKDLDELEREGVFDRVRSAEHGAARGTVSGIGRGTVNGTGCGAAHTPRPHEAQLRAHHAAGRWAQFLRLAVHHHQTIVVSGKTGSGKTTLMKALLREVDASERLITIEDTPELTLAAHSNVVHLFYSKDAQGVAQVTPQTLLEACLRMKPDRILLAELRGPECYAFIRLAASGHPGSITSVHAGSCELALEQMSLMMRQSPAGAGLGASEVQRLLRLVVDVVVQFDRDAQGRHLSQVHYVPRRQVHHAPQRDAHDAPQREADDAPRREPPCLR